MSATIPPIDTPVQTRPQFLAVGPSIVLDVVRILAALTVAIGHLTAYDFTIPRPSGQTNFAIGAVSVFFVLSGFMIRYITTVKYGDARRYAADRIARIYSVVLPAMALTVLFDLLSSHFNYTYYQANFGDYASQRLVHIILLGPLLAQTWFRRLMRVVFSLVMLSQSWFRDSAPLSNNPFWSLSYECVYYAAFGIAVYFKGARRVAAWVLLFLLIGPTIFLMFPLWLLGCAAYDAYQYGVLNRRSLGKLVGLSLLSIAGVHGSRALVEHFHANWFYIGRLVPYMDFVAIASVAILLPACIAARNLQISESHLAVRAIRRAAAATFPLYLTHFPLYVLLSATVPYPHSSLWAKFALLATAVGLSLVLSGPCDRLKDVMRRKLLPPRRS